MESHHFFCQVDHAENFTDILDGFCRIADRLEQQTYVLQKPLSEEGEEYSHSEYLVYLSSKKKILIFDFSEDPELAEEIRSEFIEDLIAYSKRFKYNKIIGRSSSWGDLIEVVSIKKAEVCEELLTDIIQGAALQDITEIKKGND